MDSVIEGYEGKIEADGWMKVDPPKAIEPEQVVIVSLPVAKGTADPGDMVRRITLLENEVRRLKERIHEVEQNTTLERLRGMVQFEVRRIKAAYRIFKQKKGRPSLEDLDKLHKTMTNSEKRNRPGALLRPGDYDRFKKAPESLAEAVELEEAMSLEGQAEDVG